MLSSSALCKSCGCPVEAAFLGIPVIFTRVGAQVQSLPSESTIWVGREEVDEEEDGQANVATNVGGSLASVSDWDAALVCFARFRSELKAEARRARPELEQRFGKAALARSRTRTVQVLLRPKPPGDTQELFSSLSPSSRATPPVKRTADYESSEKEYAASAGGSGVEGAAMEEKERVRRATVMHALACVCAGVLSLYRTGGGLGALGGLVSGQALLLVSLAPPMSPANVVTIVRGFIPPAVVL
ncbi:unnamed protein product [Sphacelaria rigidula]